ncbi:DUF2281 domain-containing protein [Pontibacter sp. E15-1]|uniref:type II toxin-antitoxin system VapB family antitoxin n=1 Tax=Pontibacter sp. E15-1 TaxID=2919918 RepID=UPI001F4F8B5A|nr:DUF2281 domain-containing protein [Pontibacter sp. E15-1]MCJ8163700.1 DUF2281 domain-containing protein [Pontibacter sp. E15-1]
MTHLQLFTKLSSLPPALKAEVSDFIDFLLSKKKKAVKANKPKFGYTKGQFKMSPDFDEPLDDFKEYVL